MTLEEFVNWMSLIEKNWDSIGSCDSCGYHDSLNGYDIWQSDIEEALISEKGRLELLCHNEDGGSDHRGVRIYLKELTN